MPSSLNNASPSALGFSPSSCVGLRYGYAQTIAICLFLAASSRASLLFLRSYRLPIARRVFNRTGTSACASPPRLALSFCVPTVLFAVQQYRKFLPVVHRLRLGLRLRSRLTQGRSALPETLDIRPKRFPPSSCHSIPAFSLPYSPHSLVLLHPRYNAPHQCIKIHSLSFGGVFQPPGHFRRRDLSTSELLRTLFNGWLFSSQHLVVFEIPHPFRLHTLWDLSCRSGSFLLTAQLLFVQSDSDKHQHGIRFDILLVSFDAPRKFSALTLHLTLSRPSLKSYFPREPSYLRFELDFSPLSSPPFQRMRVRSSIAFYGALQPGHDRSPGFGSTRQNYDRPLQDLALTSLRTLSP